MDGFDAAQTFAAPAGSCVRAGSRVRSVRLGRRRGGGWHGHAAPGQAAPGASARRGWRHRGVAPKGAGATPFRPA